MKKHLLFFLGTFIFLNAQSQTANFEVWQNYNVAGVQLHIANGWHGLDSSIVMYGALLNPGAPFYAQIEKETPGNGSIAALKVVTKNQSELTGIIPAGPFPSLASNAVISVNTGTGGFDLLGGWAFNNNPVSATMWIKNAPVSGDSTSITVYAIDNSDGGDSIAAIADTLLGATINSWTKITLPFKYNTSGFNTTLVRVLISSSGNFGSDTTTGAFIGLHDSTSLTVDDIEIVAPTGVRQYVYSSKAANVYPTLVSDILNVNFQQNDETAYLLNIYDVKGSQIKTVRLSKLINTVDLSSLTNGDYIFSIRKNKQIIQTGKLTKF